MFDWALNMSLELTHFECCNSALFLIEIDQGIRDVNYIILNKPFFFSEFLLSFINFQRNYESKKKADLVAISSPDFMLTKSQY